MRFLDFEEHSDLPRILQGKFPNLTDWELRTSPDVFGLIHNEWEILGNFGRAIGLDLDTIPYWELEDKIYSPWLTAYFIDADLTYRSKDVEGRPISPRIEILERGRYYFLNYLDEFFVRDKTAVRRR